MQYAPMQYALCFKTRATHDVVIYLFFF